MLEVSSFQKSYHEHLILDVSQLTIPKGVSWFEGVNGSGKSTFFKAVAGIIPFEGEIALKGLSLKQNVVEFRRKVNYSYAEPRYPAFLSGKEIIDYHQKVYQSDGSEVKILIESFGVEKYYETPIGNYSSGMLKKISLISALIGKPDLLLLDEPLTTIDAASQNHLLAFLAEQECSILIASHHALPAGPLKVSHHFLVDNMTIKQVS
ncbi:ATP-binding cassette domain-containing protein [Jiulongibacter sediminis]|uniref:ABC transporter ATP-binding protein n=1 Tax=Jiulongibacter sediminis TaxID=1605367 RepID=UPI0026EF2C23|nr:ATP-binding cassette domain-containing protein [Jiulongibacter sediminis]